MLGLFRKNKKAHISKKEAYLKAKNINEELLKIKNDNTMHPYDKSRAISKVLGLKELSPSEELKTEILMNIGKGISYEDGNAIIAAIKSGKIDDEKAEEILRAGYTQS